jgi:hypothetical protein
MMSKRSANAKAQRRTPEGKRKDKAACAKWRAANPDWHQQRHAERMATEPAYVADKRQRAKEYYLAHPERKPANNAKAREKYKTTSGALRDHRRFKFYGVSPEQFGLMAFEQGFGCVICKSPVPLVVDHNHKTGTVRGLLCHTCNTALGMLRDEPDLCLAAAEYLRKN